MTIELWYSIVIPCPRYMIRDEPVTPKKTRR